MRINVIQTNKHSKKGITLIALVITIIILLILAGVVITLTIGEDGLLRTAKNATTSYEEQQAREKLEIVLLDMQADKATNSKYNKNEYLTNKIEQKGFIVNENIVIVDAFQFEIDREKLIILKYLGKINENLENFELRNLEIELKTTRNSISASVSSINNNSNYLNSEVCEYRFSKDNGKTWTEYQSYPEYIFNDLYGDLTGEIYTIMVEAKDKKGNIKQASKSTKTNCLLETYYRNTSNELLLTANGRTFKKSNDGGAISGLAIVKGSQDWLTVVLVSPDISAVEYYTSYSNTNISSLGSIDYYGTTYYYSGISERMPASSSYTTTLPILNNTTDIYDNVEDAVRSLLDRYFLNTAYINTANEVFATIEDRTFIKTNSADAIATLYYWKNASQEWLGPILVSTNPSAVEYYTSYSNASFAFKGSVQYNGTTYYYSNALEHMPASSLYTTTLPILNSKSNMYEYDDIENVVLDLLNRYYGI